MSNEPMVMLAYRLHMFTSICNRTSVLACAISLAAGCGGSAERVASPASTHPEVVQSPSRTIGPPSGVEPRSADCDAVLALPNLAADLELGRQVACMERAPTPMPSLAEVDAGRVDPQAVADAVCSVVPDREVATMVGQFAVGVIRRRQRVDCVYAFTVGGLRGALTVQVFPDPASTYQGHASSDGRSEFATRTTIAGRPAIYLGILPQNANARASALPLVDWTYIVSILDPASHTYLVATLELRLNYPNRRSLKPTPQPIAPFTQAGNRLLSAIVTELVKHQS